MKVFLISANRCTDPYPVFPLGLATVAEALRREGHTVEIFDCLWDSGLEMRLGAFVPELVGISLRNIDNENSLSEEWYLDDARRLVERSRTACSAPVVLGGAGFSVMPDAILTYTGADYGIAGEGERLIVELADMLERGAPPAVRIFRQIQPLNRMEIGTCLHDEKWVAQYASGGGGFGIQTKRGCPHRCVYCSYPSIEGRTLRARDPEAVVEEMAWLGEHCAGASVFFTDSVFNDGQGLWREVVNALLHRNNRVAWSAYFRPGGLSAEDIALMKRSGLRSAELGTDAASDTALRGLGKNFTFAEAEACNRLFAQHSVPAAHFLMFGGPDETPASVREGIANIKRLAGAVIFPFMGIRILPGTPLHRRATRDGVITETTDLLKPAYYLSPSLDRFDLRAELVAGFADISNVIFPPNEMRDFTEALRSMGHGGSLWELLATALARRNRRVTPPANPASLPR